MDKNKAISGYEKIFDDGYKAGRASVVLPHPCDGDLPGGGQAIDVITDMLDDTEIEGYYKGNIIKYIARYKGKGGAEPLKKARWYLDKLIALKETQEEIDAE